MALPDVSILVYFGPEFSNGLFFTLDDPVKGVLDNTTYLIAGDDGDGVEVAGDGFSISISRGRSRELDEFEVGTCTVSLWNFNRVYDALNTAGIYYGELVPGKRIVVKVWGQIVFTGTIENWDIDWQVDGTATATLQAEDCLGQLGRKEFDAWTSTPGQDAGARITSILDRPEVIFGANRDIGVGVSTLQGDSVTWGSNVLSYAQLVTKSEYGRLFASRNNLLTFRGRFSLIGSGVAATFADFAELDIGDGSDLDIGDGSGDILAIMDGIPFNGITTQVGSELLFNRVGVDREGGTLQTSEDDVSQSKYGVRSLSLTGLLMDSDLQSLAMAEYLRGIYSEPTPRISTITVDVSSLDASQRAQVAGLEIGQLVQVMWTPLNLDPEVVQTAVVEGNNHDVTVDTHVVTLRLAPSTQSAVFILDDPVFGVVDTGPGVLTF